VLITLTRVPILQAHESLTRGHFPAREETLQHLAAQRLQFLFGDTTKVTWSLENVYPVGRLRSRILQFTKVGGASGSGQTLERRRTSFLDGTLRRGLKTGSMKKQRMEEEQMLEMWIKEEMSATRASIVEKWSRLSGLDQHQAMLRYMTIIKEWPGYGSTLFDVEVSLRIFYWCPIRSTWSASASVLMLPIGSVRPELPAHMGRCS